MAVAHTRVFVSHSSKNASFVDKLVERLRDHYISTWYAPRHMPGGYFAANIRQSLKECDWFLLVLSPEALQSEWVKTELDIAMEDPRYYNRVLPLLTEPCDWTTLHQHLGRYQLFDFVTLPIESEARLLSHLGVTPLTFPPVLVGDVKMPVHVFVGGDGVTVFREGDIHCSGPGLPTDDTRMFQPEADVLAFAQHYLPKREVECRQQDKVFVNNRQVRILGATWGSPNAGGGLDNRPLRLDLGWTQYYHTAVTNMKTDERLEVDGRTIGQKYAAPIDNLRDCQLSNPIATNLSVVTADNYILYGQRSHKVQTLAGGYQPAVSGDGQPEDVSNGIYNPFQTALREAREECIGLLTPAPTAADVTFFGLGRWMKTRFPFLFGELRLKEARLKDVMSYEPTQKWEGVRLALPFTVEDVTQWCVDRYRDQYFGRAAWPVSSPIFSLLQSLRYAYPDRWPEVIRRLDLPEIPTPTATPTSSQSP